MGVATKQLRMPCGLEEQGGIVHRDLEIRKLKGRIQRDVARMQAQKRANAADILDAILTPSIIRVGNEPATPMTLRAMHVADRDWVLFELRKLTWGSLVTAKHPCQTCDEVMIYEDFDLDTLKIVTLGDDVPWWNGERVVEAEELEQLEPADRQALRCRVLVLENDELGVRGVFRFGNGDDQALIGKLADRPIDALWRMMSLTCIQWKDPEHDIDKPPRKGIKDSFWEDVDMDIVDWAQAAYRDAQPGVDTNIELVCANDHLQEVLLSPTDFFFPEVAKRRSRS
jgi:hypothetical protein